MSLDFLDGAILNVPARVLPSSERPPESSDYNLLLLVGDQYRVIQGHYLKKTVNTGNWDGNTAVLMESGIAIGWFDFNVGNAVQDFITSRLVEQQQSELIQDSVVANAEESVTTGDIDNDVLHHALCILDTSDPSDFLDISSKVSQMPIGTYEEIEAAKARTRAIIDVLVGRQLVSWVDATIRTSVSISFLGRAIVTSGFPTVAPAPEAAAS